VSRLLRIRPSIEIKSSASKEFREGETILVDIQEKRSRKSENKKRRQGAGGLSCVCQRTEQGDGQPRHHQTAN